MPETAPNQSIVKEFYDEQYYSSIKSTGKPNKHLKLLAQRLNIQQGHTVLDIACGTGEWLKAAEDQGANTFGVDLSEKAIEFCKKTYNSENYICQPAEKLPYDDCSFDIVTCLGSLEHFPDKEKSLKEMVRVTKPGGTLLILVPNSNFIGYTTGLYKGTNQSQAIETPLSIQQWSRLFQSSGIKIEKTWKDLHFLNKEWFLQNGFFKSIPRAIAGTLIALLPIEKQYQIYFLCSKSSPHKN